jgi:hypothetical protein
LNHISLFAEPPIERSAAIVFILLTLRIVPGYSRILGRNIQINADEYPLVLSVIQTMEKYTTAPRLLRETLPDAAP